MATSYFPYAASFTTTDSGAVDINVGLIGIGLVLAPFVFVVVAFVSQNPLAPRRVLQSMGLMFPVALGIGLLSPVLGATAAFAVGATLCLRPLGFADTYKWRLWSALLAVIYTLVLLVLITPAGVFTGGLLPLMMIGFADEYTWWSANRPRAS